MAFSLQFLDDSLTDAEIADLDDDNGHHSYKYAEITVGTFRERMLVSTQHWSPRQYEVQWASQLQAILADANGKAGLITDWSEDTISYWALYRQGEDVYVQEMMIERAVGMEKVNSSVVPHFIGERHQGASEWHVTVPELKEWLGRLKNTYADPDIDKLNSTDKENFEKLKAIVENAGVAFEYEVDENLWYSNVTIKAASDIHIWMNRDRPDEKLYCTTLSFEGLWWDGKPNSENRFVLVNNEIIDIVRALLNKEMKFYPSPSWLNKKKGFVIVTIDSKKERIVQKSNVFGLPVELAAL